MSSMATTRSQQRRFFGIFRRSRRLTIYWSIFTAILRVTAQLLAKYEKILCDKCKKYIFFTSFLLTPKVDSQAVSKSATWFPGASYKYQSVPLIWDSLDQCFVVICARSGAHFFYFCWILRMWWYEWIWSFFTHPRHRIITKYTTSKSKEYCY